jgi:hypothetical protein
MLQTTIMWQLIVKSDESLKHPLNDQTEKLKMLQARLGWAGLWTKAVDRNYLPPFFNRLKHNIDCEILNYVNKPLKWHVRNVQLKAVYGTKDR